MLETFTAETFAGHVRETFRVSTGLPEPLAMESVKGSGLTLVRRFRQVLSGKSRYEF